MTLLDYRPRARAAPNAPQPWHPMHTLREVGRKVRLRLAGPEKQRLGEIVTGWRAMRTTGPTWFTWDRTARAHVEVKPTGWQPLPDKEPPRAA